MSDLISRSALIEAITDVEVAWYIDGNYTTYDATTIVDIIQSQPTVEAKPVVCGEWKRVGSGSLYDTYECTNCHHPPKWDCLGDNHWRIAFTDICPHCGAEMRGGKNERKTTKNLVH